MSGLELVGLATNIVQFIEFGHKIIDNAVRIYESASGATVESDDFELSEDRFNDVRKKIESSFKKLENEKLLEICDLCKSIGEDLSKEYGKLKEPRDGKHNVRRKLRCLWKATKGAWGSDYITAQKERLEKLKNDLNLHVVVNMRSTIVEFFEEFPTYIDELNTLGRAVLKDIMENRRVLEEAESRIKDANHAEHEESRRLISETRRGMWHISETIERKSQSNCLNLLPFVDIATFDNHKRSDNVTCLEDTRVEVLEEIAAWANCRDNKRLCWLTGFAGSGKSTIARTIAHTYESQRRLAASFFFSKTVGGDARRSHKFVTSIAYQLAQHSTELRGLISKALELDEMVIHKSLSQQWQQLIYEPLKDMEASSFKLPILVIVDALDECEDYDDIKVFVNLCAGLQQLGDLQVRTLIASRPDTVVREGFDKISKSDYKILSLQDVPSEAVDSDISRLFCNEFEAIRKKRKNLSAEWPGADNVEALVERSGGLFIWADTACRFVREGGKFSQKRISKLLESDLHMIAPEKGLDMLYITVLKESISPKDSHYDKEEKDLLCKQLRSVLGALVISLSALSIFAISCLTQLSEDEISDILDPLQSILEISDKHEAAIRLHHPSFRDFLVNGERCTDVRFLIDESQSHADLTSGCIQIMSKELRRDICNLCELGILSEDVSRSRVKDSIPEPLDYACQYWVDHVKQSVHSIGDDSETFGLLKKHFTHWLEALSLTRKLRSGILSINTLETLTINDSDAYAFISDARLFLRKNEHVIDLAPLQLYCSSIPFTPRQSRIFETFESEIPCGIRCLSELTYSQESLIKVLDKHQGFVKDLKFSPDGNLLASSSGFDEGALLWDPATGADLQCYSDGPRSPRLLYSPNNALLALIGLNAVQLVKTDTIAIICNFRDFVGQIMAAAFSADSKLLAVRNLNGIITIFDVASCRKIDTISNGKVSHGSVILPDFHADLFWMDNGGEVGIDLSKYNSEKNIPEIVGNIAACWNAALELDGRKLLVIWINKLQLLELSSGSLVKSLSLDNYSWSEVLISPTLEYFVGKKSSGIVEVWNIFEGEMILAYEVQSFCRISQGTFSKDNHFLATPMTQASIGLWDLRSRKISILDCPSSPTVLTFSPDVTCLAVGHKDGVVCFWDLDSVLKSHTTLTRSELESKAKQRLLPFEYFDYRMKMVSMPQRESIATAHLSNFVAIRSMNSGKTTSLIADLPFKPAIVKHSPVTNTLVVLFCDNYLRLYELGNCAVIKQIKVNESRKKPIYDIIISNNGKHLVLCSRASMELRSASSLEHVHLFETYCCRGMAISNDSNYFAVDIDEIGIQVWDLIECKEHFVIDTSTCLTGLTFSTDSSMMAYTGIDSALTLYDFIGKEVIWTVHFDEGVGNSLSFSPNDTLLAVCGEGEEGILLYSTDNGKLIGENRSVPELEEMRFSADGNFIDTRLGQFKLTSLFPEVKMLKEFTDVSAVEEGYHIIGKWLMKGSKRFIWLPPEHRGNFAVVQGKSIAIGSNEDHLTIIRVEAYQPEPW